MKHNNQNFPITSDSNSYGGFAGMNDGFVLRLNGATDQIMLGRWIGSAENDFITDIDGTPSGPIFIGITKAQGYSTVTNAPANDGKFPNYAPNQEFQHTVQPLTASRLATASTARALAARAKASQTPLSSFVRS